MKPLNGKENHPDRKKILLAVLPYWDPLIPPKGISHLKTFLLHYGYTVVTKDANTGDVFKDLYDLYFDTIKKYVPPKKRGNFFNIGHDVMRNHMTAHMNGTNEKEYIGLLKELVYQTFYTHFADEQILELDGVVAQFYHELENYASGLLEEIKPGVLGISVFRDTLGPSLFMFKLAKEKYPHIQTVMGGCIFSDILFIGTPNLESFLEVTPYIDKIIIGEGQDLFLKLLRGELPESRRVFTLKDIGGATLDFSPLNTPDISDFDVRQYPYLSAQSSISCPYQCSFCNVHEFFGKYKKKGPGQTAAEMIALYKKYGSQLFFMCDSLLNYTATGLAEEFIKSGIKLYWDGYIRVGEEVCDLENTLLWRRGGFYRARLGTESGSQKMLDRMNKKITVEQIKSALHSLANAGIKTTTYWVIGHPGETGEDFQATLDLLEEMRDSIYEAECNAFVYGYTGQADADKWEAKRKLLYPESAKNMLIVRSWTLDCEPSREVTYNRVGRFIEHCNKLGIPNPYSLYDIYKADERWQKLYKNAVPALVDFKQKNRYIDDTDKVEASFVMQNTLVDDGEFGF